MPAAQQQFLEFDQQQQQFGNLEFNFPEVIMILKMMSG